MKSVGLDVSTYIGMFLAGDGEDRGKCVHFPKERGRARLKLIEMEVGRVLDAWEPHFCVIEGYAFGNRGSLVTLVECGTVVRGLLYDRKISWVEVPPTTLKLWTTGKGNAKKDPDMKDAVKKRWGFQSPSDDIVDAFALAQMGQLDRSNLLAIKGVTLGT